MATNIVQDSAKRLTRSEEVMVASAGLSPGAAVYQRRGCMNCHSLQGKGGSVGPALDKVGKRLKQAEIRRYIRDPKAVNAKAIMPAQKDLSNKELDEVARFLANLK